MAMDMPHGFAMWHLCAKAIFPILAAYQALAGLLGTEAVNSNDKDAKALLPCPSIDKDPSSTSEYLY